MIKVEIAEYSGYCFGVKRALEMTEEALSLNERGAGVYTLGSIIHNPGVVRGLSRAGLVTARGIEDVDEGSMFVVRSHGMPPGLVEELERKNVRIIDATCPFVKKAQSRAKGLSREGYYVVVIGDIGHPEVQGIMRQVEEGKIIAAGSMEDLASVGHKKKIGVVVQTTQTMEKLKQITNGLLGLSKEVRIINTICDTTKNRQDSVRDLSGRVDVMIVAGGKNSANTTHLAEISRESNPSTFHIESSADLQKKWFRNARKAGISGGASTPEKDIMDIKKKIEEMRF